MLYHQLNKTGVPHVAGATLARDHVKELLDAVLPGIPDPGKIVVVDFKGIEAATASYIKGTILTLLNEGRASAADDRSGRNVFPVVTGVSPEVAEELDEVLGANQVACLEAVAWAEGRVTTARLRGPVDGALREALRALTVAGSTTATQLCTKHQTTIRISTTGWNNRLALLHQARLARREKQGRQWVYQPVAEVLING